MERHRHRFTLFQKVLKKRLIFRLILAQKTNMGNAAQQATSQELVELVQKIIKCEHSDYQTVLKKTWDRYNKDKNDFLDKEECKELITHMIQLLFPTSNANDSNAQAELIFEVLDANDDGVVTFGVCYECFIIYILFLNRNFKPK